MRINQFNTLRSLTCPIRCLWSTAAFGCRSYRLTRRYPNKCASNTTMLDFRNLPGWLFRHHIQVCRWPFFRIVPVISVTSNSRCSWCVVPWWWCSRRPNLSLRAQTIRCPSTAPTYNANRKNQNKNTCNNHTNYRANIQTRSIGIAGVRWVVILQLIPLAPFEWCITTECIFFVIAPPAPDIFTRVIRFRSRRAGRMGVLTVPIKTENRKTHTHTRNKIQQSTTEYA